MLLEYHINFIECKFFTIFFNNIEMFERNERKRKRKEFHSLSFSFFQNDIEKECNDW